MVHFFIVKRLLSKIAAASEKIAKEHHATAENWLAGGEARFISK